MTAPRTNRQSILKFDPTFNMGTIVSILVFTVGGLTVWNRIETSLATQKLEIEQTKTVQAQQAEATKSIGSDVKELSRVVADMRMDVAVLRSRLRPDPVATVVTPVGVR